MRTPVCATAALLLASSLVSAQAAEPQYAGTLGTGTFSASVAAESGPWATPEAWSLWRFLVPFGSEVSIDVAPASANMDVVLAVWYGQEADTSGYFDMLTGGVASTFVDGADAGGPGASESVRFDNYYGGDYFVLGVADYADGRGSGLLAYTVTAAVPEPASAALLAAGAGLLAFAQRTRRRRDR